MRCYNERMRVWKSPNDRLAFLGFKTLTAAGFSATAVVSRTGHINWNMHLGNGWSGIGVVPRTGHINWNDIAVNRDFKNANVVPRTGHINWNMGERDDPDDSIGCAPHGVHKLKYWDAERTESILRCAPHGAHKLKSYGWDNSFRFPCCAPHGAHKLKYGKQRHVL